MLLKEIFPSIQGEGIQIGESVVFIRFSGCNQKCSWCDTDHGNGQTVYVQEILEEVTKYNSNAVVLTGGEPLIQEQTEMILLLRGLKKMGKHITIETNGTVYDSNIDYYVDLWSVSPKLKNSGLRVDIVSILAQFLQTRKALQIKFVVDSEEDIIEVESCLDSVYDLVQLAQPSIIFQPVYKEVYNGNTTLYMEKMADLVQILKGFDYSYRVLPQLHRLANVK